MYIEPNTNIKLLTNVPLDNTYEHTIYFDSPSEQQTYFASKAKRNFTNQTFQRVNKGIARLQVNIGDVYDCNYMMFQNTSFSTKWFYAFITKVEYVNNAVTEIEFELDDMQTWWFDYTLGECYIERQHTETDAIGDNITPEPVALGEYVFNHDSISDLYNELEYENGNPLLPQPIPLPNGTKLSDLCVLIAIVDVQATASDGHLYDNIYGAATIYAYNREDVSGINTLVGQYVQKPDSIIGMYMCPKIAIPVVVPDTGGVQLQDSTGGIIAQFTGNQLVETNTLDGHVVKNKKLFTYPYNFFHIDNANGSALELRYEFMKNLTPKLWLLTTITQPIQAVLKPVLYKNLQVLDQNETLAIAGYPMCSWNVDAYKAWIAQNSVPLGMGVVGSIVQGGIQSLATGNPAAFVGNTLNSVLNVAQQSYTASIQADMSKGSFNNGGANCTKLQQAFFGGRMSVSKDIAKRIDDFFSYFGYQINALGVPNRNARPYWTYVKTHTCVFTGSVPNDSMSHIAKIYNNGITFWNNGENVGNYQLDNSVS